MRIIFDRFKNGCNCAFTFSYDDGNIADRRLVEIFNRYGMKATFHLNSESLGWDSSISADEIKSLYAGHEVSCHMVNHPHPTRIPFTSVAAEIMNDRRALESACGYVVRGMSYPYGSHNEDVIAILRACGMEYSRTTRATDWFAPPDDFMYWHPTCHHNNSKLHELFDRFSNPNQHAPLQIMNVWGHSYEFDQNDNWHIIEDFCKYASGHDNVWYATNIEICDYINAVRRLAVGVDGDVVHNPSGVDVWATVNDECVKIPAGSTVSFRKDI